jgi:murein DD-endopeptidase MepM/ murein hydrolase activator NlpD
VSDRLSNFRVYKADISVNTTLDHEEEPDSALPATDTPTNNGATSGPVNPNGWSFPTTAGAQLSDKGAFGPRDGGFHTGIDLAVPSGSPFYATRDGTILVREYDIRSIAGGAWCKVIPSESFMQKDIWITHDVDGVKYTSVYAHMSSYAKKTGDVVKAGELIGYTGGSGCSTGPHVHFEIWQGNANPSVPGPGMQDPWPLINK